MLTPTPAPPPTRSRYGSSVRRRSRGEAHLGRQGELPQLHLQFHEFQGRAALLGDARQPAAKGVYVWPNGSGTVKTDGSAADVTFGAADGVHFQSHPMTIGGKSVYALDMTFTKPRIVITSPTTGELRMDAAGYEFKSMTEVGAPYLLENALIATLRLPTPTKKGTTFTWTDAAATLTSEGAIAFGEFYEPGETLDPVTFSSPPTARSSSRSRRRRSSARRPRRRRRGRK
ncbi:HtaA domain-containing protein [Leucobacter soli]|uniref:HtaA domain-containing protein n=1 Tax=Leucobacter soli TaxID=2812850 RepID=UPI00360E753D